jgi:hypothetical protein
MSWRHCNADTRAGALFTIYMDEIGDMESEIILLQDLVKPQKKLRLEPFGHLHGRDDRHGVTGGKLPLGRC